MPVRPLLDRLEVEPDEPQLLRNGPAEHGRDHDVVVEALTSLVLVEGVVLGAHLLEPFTDAALVALHKPQVLPTHHAVVLAQDVLDLLLGVGPAEHLGVEVIGQHDLEAAHLGGLRLLPVQLGQQRGDVHVAGDERDGVPVEVVGDEAAVTAQAPLRFAVGQREQHVLQLLGVPAGHLVHDEGQVAGDRHALQKRVHGTAVLARRYRQVVGPAVHRHRDLAGRGLAQATVARQCDGDAVPHIRLGQRHQRGAEGGTDEELVGLGVRAVVDGVDLLDPLLCRAAHTEVSREVWGQVEHGGLDAPPGDFLVAQHEAVVVPPETGVGDSLHAMGSCSADRVLHELFHVFSSLLADRVDFIRTQRVGERLGFRDGLAWHLDLAPALVVHFHGEPDGEGAVFLAEAHVRIDVGVGEVDPGERAFLVFLRHLEELTVPRVTLGPERDVIRQLRLVLLGVVVRDFFHLWRRDDRWCLHNRLGLLRHGRQLLRVAQMDRALAVGVLAPLAALAQTGEVLTGGGAGGPGVDLHLRRLGVVLGVSLAPGVRLRLAFYCMFHQPQHRAPEGFFDVAALLGHVAQGGAELDDPLGRRRRVDFRPCAPLIEHGGVDLGLGYFGGDVLHQCGHEPLGRDGLGVAQQHHLDFSVFAPVGARGAQDAGKVRRAAGVMLEPNGLERCVERLADELGLLGRKVFRKRPVAVQTAPRRHEHGCGNTEGTTQLGDSLYGLLARRVVLGGADVHVEPLRPGEGDVVRRTGGVAQLRGVRLGRHLAFFGERGAGVKNLNARIIDLTGEAGEVFEALAVVVGWRAIHPVAECRQDVDTLGRQDFLKERQRVHLPPSVGLV